MADEQTDMFAPEQPTLLDVPAEVPKQASLYGENLFGEEIVPASRGVISDRFILAPFTILNTREGFWLERRRAWLSLGIRSEVGRDEGLTMDHATSDWFGKVLDDRGGKTSVFDPVLCEMAYRWFCPERGQVVDPFSGGSVRGIVAAHLGLSYWGSDLSSRQIEANKEQGREIVPDNQPEWVCGDSAKVVQFAPAADFIFSCPPYGDLEVYSDDPADISNMDYSQFLVSYSDIIGKTLGRLRADRFACFVVGDFRDKRTGLYQGFVADTITAFEEHGAHLYNEAILVNSAGSLPVRITKQFDSGRKMGKCHQNVLVFVKGDWRVAAAACVEGR